MQNARARVGVCVCFATSGFEGHSVSAGCIFNPTTANKQQTSRPSMLAESLSRINEDGILTPSTFSCAPPCFLSEATGEFRYCTIRQQERANSNHGHAYVNKCSGPNIVLVRLPSRLPCRGSLSLGPHGMALGCEEPASEPTLRS